MWRQLGVEKRKLINKINRCHLNLRSFDIDIIREKKWMIKELGLDGTTKSYISHFKVN